MEQKIQLTHPQGEKAVRIDKTKYDTMKKAILNSLKKNAELTHSEMLKSIPEYFKKNKVKFEGAVGWYMEWVKLDLEANKIIERFTEKSKMKFRLAK